MELEGLSYPELWCLRQILRGSEVEAASSRHEAESELERRLSGDGATKAGLAQDLFITLKPSVKHEYTASGVEGLKEFLVGGNLVSEEEWDQAVSWVPRVNGHAVNRWMKMGGHIKALIERARMGASGKPQWSGPSFAEMVAAFPEEIERVKARLE